MRGHVVDSTSRHGRSCRRDPSLLDNKENFNLACSFFVRQAGDLAVSSVPAVPSLLVQVALSKCPQYTGAITY